MYSPLPEDWDDLVRSGAQRIYVLDVIPDPEIGEVAIADIPIQTFQITIDRRSDIRRTGSATIVHSELLDALKTETSGLEPYGAEIRVRSGFVRGDSTTALVNVGFFLIEDITWTEDESSFEVTFKDRSSVLERSQFGTPIDASGKLVHTFINDALFETLPRVELVIDSDITNIHLPGGTTYRAGKLAAIQEAAKSVGAEFFFDADGIARVTAVPFLDTINGPGSPDWIIDAGANGVMISYNRSISRANAYNKIHVWGAPKDEDTPQPYASAEDDNPASPTYYGGRFGRVDLRIERQELTDSGQCLEYARAYLRNSIGLSRSIDISLLGNHALDVGDIILAVYPDGEEEFHLVDMITFAADGAMTISTRTQTEPV